MLYPLSLFAARLPLLLGVGLITAAFAVFATMLFPREYRADAQVLIISQTRSGVDPYTVVKSAERVGENIAAVMKTDDFQTKVRQQPGYTLDWSRFDALNERQRRRAWRRMIQGSVVFGTGVLNVSAFHTDPAEARALSGAAVEALSARGWEYVGGDVALKIVNAPIVTRFPVRPNIAVNAILGLIVGVFAGVLIIYKRN